MWRSFVLLSFRVRTTDQDFRSSMAISVVGVMVVRSRLLSFRVGSVIFNTG